MSYEINGAIELSSDELDLVAGGDITESQAATLKKTKHFLDNTFAVTPDGTFSKTIAFDSSVLSKGGQSITVS